jgi:hypothetical protein
MEVLAEVVGSNPTKSHPVHFFLCWKYGIGLSSFWVTGGQIQQQCQYRIAPDKSWKLSQVLLRSEEREKKFYY